MRGRVRKNGQCKLTGEFGKLVKAHILPKALTGSDLKGLPFAQAGRDTPPIKRWDSWYDPEIVTQAGEDILTSLDTWAILELRRHKLVWSGWGEAGALDAGDHVEVPSTPWGIRRIRGIDGQRLRLFFLSLLWRAAVSGKPEFREIDVRASEIRRLRRALLAGDPSPSELFPISLTQLSTKGQIHNLTPLATRRPCDPARPHGPSIPVFRFYFDGLIAHFHRERSPEDVEALGGMLLGEAEVVEVSTVTFEASWQRENMEELVREAVARWPDRLSKIPGFS